LGGLEDLFFVIPRAVTINHIAKYGKNDEKNPHDQKCFFKEINAGFKNTKHDSL